MSSARDIRYHKLCNIRNIPKDQTTQLFVKKPGKLEVKKTAIGKLRQLREGKTLKINAPKEPNQRVLNKGNRFASAPRANFDKQEPNQRVLNKGKLFSSAPRTNFNKQVQKPCNNKTNFTSWKKIKAISQQDNTLSSKIPVFQKKIKDGSSIFPCDISIIEPVFRFGSSCSRQSEQFFLSSTPMCDAVSNCKSVKEIESQQSIKDYQSSPNLRKKEAEFGVLSNSGTPRSKSPSGYHARKLEWQVDGKTSSDFDAPQPLKLTAERDIVKSNGNGVNPVVLPKKEHGTTAGAVMKKDLKSVLSTDQNFDKFNNQVDTEEISKVCAQNVSGPTSCNGHFVDSTLSQSVPEKEKYLSTDDSVESNGNAMVSDSSTGKHSKTNDSVIKERESSVTLPLDQDFNNMHEIHFIMKNDTAANKLPTEINDKHAVDTMSSQIVPKEGNDSSTDPIVKANANIELKLSCKDEKYQVENGKLELHQSKNFSVQRHKIPSLGSYFEETRRISCFIEDEVLPGYQSSLFDALDKTFSPTFSVENDSIFNFDNVTMRGKNASMNSSVFIQKEFDIESDITVFESHASHFTREPCAKDFYCLLDQSVSVPVPIYSLAKGIKSPPMETFDGDLIFFSP